MAIVHAEGPSPRVSGLVGRERPSLAPRARPHRDLSMILCDPFAINTLSLSTVRHLQELVGQELLPRVSAPGWPRAAFWGTRGCGESAHTRQVEGTCSQSPWLSAVRAGSSGEHGQGLCLPAGQPGSPPAAPAAGAGPGGMGHDRQPGLQGTQDGNGVRRAPSRCLLKGLWGGVWGGGEEDGPQAHVREDERRKGAEGQGRCRTALGPLPQEVELVTRFLPTLMSFVVDDHAFNVDQKLPAEEKAPVSYPSALPETFTKYGLRALGGRAFPSGSLGADGARTQVPAGAARGLRGGAVLRAAHHQAEEQERAPAPAPGSR